MITLEQARDLCGDDSPTATGIILARTMEAQEVREVVRGWAERERLARGLFPALPPMSASVRAEAQAEADRAEVLVGYLMHHLKTRDAEAAALLGRVPWPVMEARFDYIHEGRRFPWREPMRNFTAPESVPEDQREAFEDEMRQEEARTIYSGAPSVEVWDDLDAWFNLAGRYYAIPEVCHVSPLWRKALLFVAMARCWDRLVIGSMLRHVCKVCYYQDNRTIGIYEPNKLMAAIDIVATSEDGLGIWCKVTGSEANRTWITLSVHDLINLASAINQNYVPR
jgi:hypothetical protein